MNSALTNTKHSLVQRQSYTKIILAFGLSMSALLAKRLRDARLNAGLSQERLGVLAGIDEMSSSARMNQYEREKHIPDISIVGRIAKVLNLPTAYFYAEDDVEADLLCRFHRLNENGKQRILCLIQEIEKNL